ARESAAAGESAAWRGRLFWRFGEVGLEPLNDRRVDLEDQVLVLPVRLGPVAGVGDADFVALVRTAGRDGLHGDDVGDRRRLRGRPCRRRGVGFENDEHLWLPLPPGEGWGEGRCNIALLLRLSR